ncbi:hypothetical protein H6M51_07525 [Rhizobium sp. AQ_MP]|uniref:hypothetical protein n=1 Tax=Rhizobium sp. AQ_MP TaxID=2761536 RepID=UPI00163A6AC4|nr:hypothetical protein [Rhizobium sp. AQ_MP]MBC2772708.1 hypothetical protein [Rhizobium sp. AQ_MP]
MTYLQNADGQGQLLIGERVSPISYHVEVEERGDGYAAKVEMQAPRDWLIRQGFEKQATLVLASGDRAQITYGRELDVTDSISVVLRTDALEYRDRQELCDAFPELIGRES